MWKYNCCQLAWNLEGLEKSLRLWTKINKLNSESDKNSYPPSLVRYQCLVQVTNNHKDIAEVKRILTNTKLKWEHHCNYFSASIPKMAKVEKQSVIKEIPSKKYGLPHSNSNNFIIQAERKINKVFSTIWIHYQPIWKTCITYYSTKLLQMILLAPQTCPVMTKK